MAKVGVSSTKHVSGGENLQLFPGRPSVQVISTGNQERIIELGRAVKLFEVSETLKTIAGK